MIIAYINIPREGGVNSRSQLLASSYIPGEGGWTPGKKLLDSPLYTEAAHDSYL
jgi:hypothetical protein